MTILLTIFMIVMFIFLIYSMIGDIWFHHVGYKKYYGVDSRKELNKEKKK